MDQVEGHPIPQDITGFQFRLIGNMTIKQFAYLAGGSIVAWFFFSTPLPFLIKVPLAACLVGIGIVLAFIPIQGRPADIMILLFLKAVFRPNQYAYKKTSTSTTQFSGTPSTITPSSQENTKPFQHESTFLDTSGVPHQPHVDEPEPVVEKLIPLPSQQPPSENTSSEQTDTDDSQIIASEEEQLAQQAAAVSEELAEVKKQEQEPGAELHETHEKVISLESQLQDILAQKQDLEKKVLELQHKLTNTPQHVYTPTTESTPPEETQHVKKVPPPLKQSVGAPLIPDVPNLITGVVKDARGNVLPNILIEVKDRDNNAVRAFKTNQLGQFVSATPLLNGTYTISFEDPKKEQQFDTIEITADGNVLSPLEVISIDEREELRKSLFSA